MQKKIKKVLACFLAAVLFIPSGAITVSSKKAADAEISSEDERDENSASDKTYVMRTEKEVLSTMTMACENENLRFYYSENEDIFALVNKKNNYIWWSSPVNAQGDTQAKGLVKKELASSMVILYGVPDSRTTSTLRSAKNGRMIYKVKDNVLNVTYKFPMAGFTIPVEYTLEEKCLSAKIKTSQIKEENKDTDEGQILIDICVLPNMMSAGKDEDGYYVIPDGSGAVIDFNNGKTSARPYNGKIYGDDITSVPLTKPPVSEQIYLPVYGAVKKNGNGILAVLHKGDANAQILSSVSTLSKSSYNICYSKFTVRSTDTYYMSGEPLTVFEKDKIKTPELEIKFFPVNEKNIDYVDIADAYRNYLIDEQGISKKQNNMGLYVDIYGGAEKLEPVCGIPVTRKKSVTSFSQAEKILTKLTEGGADNIILSYNNWTNDGIKNKVDFKTRPASVLGNKKEFNSLIEYCKNNDISFYPTVNNKTFSAGNGYWPFSDTALRTSGQYSKQLSYNLAYGTENKLKDPESLLSPSVFGEIFSKLAKNYSKAGFDKICIGDMTYVLYGDYGKKSLSRNDMMEYVQDGLAKINDDVGSVLAHTANAYTFRYIDHISGVPLSSGKFDIFDRDIPFFQIVMHGLIPYSSASINRSADSERLFLMAVATGSNLHYDMIYEDASELKDTEYDRYYYANYYYWTDTSTGEYKLIKDVLNDVRDQYITGFEDNGTETLTTYSDGTVITVNFQTGQIKNKNSVYMLTDYIDTEGDLIF